MKELIVSNDKMLFTDETVFTELDMEFEKFHRFVEEYKHIQEQTAKARQKKTELESKMAQEIKINRARESRLSEVSRRAAELRRAAGRAPAVADTDRARLDLAREKYQVAKEFTGVRFNFQAPPNVVKGYIKNMSRSVLETFEVSEAAADGLWARVAAAGRSWPPARPRTAL